MSSASALTTRVQQSASCRSVASCTDEDPGFARLDLNYDPFTANPLGRNFKVGIRKEF